MSNSGAAEATVNSSDEAAALLLEQFRAKYPTQEDHLRNLYNVMGDSIQCQSCGSKKWQREDGERWVRCVDCRKKYWPTSHTLFERVRNFEAWLFAIHLKDHDIIISASAYHCLLGISYDCAWNIFCQLRMVINSDFPEDSLSVPSAEFAAVIAKRSRETPARLGPLSEQEVVESELGPRQTEELQNQAGENDLSPSQKRIYEELSDTPMHFDTLHQRLKMDVSAMNVALFELRLVGLITASSDPWFQRSAPSPKRRACVPNGQTANDDGLQERLLSMISAAMTSIRETFHGVSRKYLQLYLATLWQSVDKKRWREGALLYACLRFRRIRNDEIRLYVSPLFVNLAVAYF